MVNTGELKLGSLGFPTPVASGKDQAVKMIITGGSGYLGGRVADHFLDYGWHVSLLLRKTSSISHNLKLAKNCDVRYFNSLSDIQEIVASIEPSVVVHLAASYGRKRESEAELIEANVLLGVSILNACEALNSRVWFLNANTCLDQDLNGYALSKSQFGSWGRVISNKSQEKITFFDIALQQFYGPGDDVSKLPGFVLQSCLDNVPELKLTPGRQTRDFIYVNDVVDALHVLVLNRASFVGYVSLELGTGEAVPVREFVETLHKFTGASTKLRFGALPVRDGEPEECVANPVLLKTLGWSPRFSLSQGLKALVASSMSQ